MITCDTEETALSAARSLGLHGATGAGVCLTGATLDRMSTVQLSERMGNVSVFACMSPKHKMEIVGAFQARGAVVAMTGDGGEHIPFFVRLFMVLTRVLGASAVVERHSLVEDVGY